VTLAAMAFLTGTIRICEDHSTCSGLGAPMDRARQIVQPGLISGITLPLDAGEPSHPSECGFDCPEGQRRAVTLDDQCGGKTIASTPAPLQDERSHGSGQLGADGHDA
jgi:hypothetical protein